jgi:hypothetical protein
MTVTAAVEVVQVVQVAWVAVFAAAALNVVATAG